MLLPMLLCFAACERNAVKLENEFHAVLIDNNSVYFGRVENLGGPYIVLRQVYYVRTRVNPETKETTNELIRRGGEWHGPDRMIIDARHVVFIEPVTPGSQVAKLIAEDMAKH